MKNKVYLIFFGLILIATIFFRFSNLKNTPPSLFSDEVDIGYQAITYNRTLTDYFGHKFPIFFQSYSDWHTPFSIIPVAISQKFFGINVLSLKLPSIIFGILSAVFFYFLILSITKSKTLALLSFLFIGLSPWQIHYSRTNFESVTGMLLFLTLGILFWSKFIKEKSNKFLSLSLICFSLTPYFYSTAKLFIFFIFVSLLIIWRKTLLKTKITQFILPTIFCFITLLPLVLSTLLTNSNGRFAYINIFTDPTISKTVDYQRFSDSTTSNYGQIGVRPSISSKIFNNKITVISKTFFKNYLSSFSTEFLVTKGDTNLRQGFGTQGYFYYLDFFIIVIGIFYSLKKNKKYSLFFILLLIFAPIPFSLTRDATSAHATRLILMLPSLIYFMAYGYQKILKFSKIIFIALIIIFLFNFGNFWHNYNFNYPQISARYWHTGIKEIILSAESQKNNFQKIYYSSRDESMIPFFLYYTQYKSVTNPSAPAKSLIWDNSTFFTGMQTENKYYFGQVDWSNLLNDKNKYQNSLFVVNGNDYELIQKERGKFNVNIIDTQKTIFADNFIYYLVSFSAK
jgi:4-amino-4-deoxy-L-arabinose transferase-like glycosyltransferase